MTTDIETKAASIPSIYASDTYTFSQLINSDCTISPITRIKPIATMYYYARDHIRGYNFISTYPNDAEYNPNTNGVTNFSYAFYNMTNCRDSIGSIMNRFDWNSCTDMSYAFTSYKPTTWAKQPKLTGNIPYIPKNVVNLSYAFYQCKDLSIQKSLILPDTIIDMSYAFTNIGGDYLPTSLPSKVVNISHAFSDIGISFGFEKEYRCYGKIPNIPNTVKDMSYAFDSLGNVTGSIPIIPNSVTNMSSAFHDCRNLTGSLPKIPNSVSDMSDAFYDCFNLTGSIPNIPNSITNMAFTFYNCRNLTGSVPNIPNSVTDMSETFMHCYRLSSSNVYIHSNNVSNATNCFYNMGNTMNIYVHAGTATYNSFYKAMGNNTHNAKCYLKTF